MSKYKQYKRLCQRTKVINELISILCEDFSDHLKSVGQNYDVGWSVVQELAAGMKISCLKQMAKDS